MNNDFLSAAEMKARLLRGEFDARLMQFYGTSGDGLTSRRKRIADAADCFTAQYGDLPIRVFSVSGRTEMGGNHTDHQHGCVLAGGINLDILAIAAKTGGNEIRIQSEGFPEDSITLSDLSVRADENGTSAALIRGTAARFRQLGKPVQGFCAYTVSDVLKGSGLSSSAAFEVMIGTICNDFFADSSFSLAETAMIAQYAENVYFGKPCGLMDQMACALGSVAAIDFQREGDPQWEQITLNLAEKGYALCIVDSRADHADLTDEYAAVPAEMRSVAAYLGKDVLRETDEQEFWEKLPELRLACGDRAVLRAIHFYGDHARAELQAQALRKGDFDAYLQLVRESGRSSMSYLQNISPGGRPQAQAVAVALAVCDRLLAGKGAYRVHGGGFAGTVQAYVPLAEVDAFRRGTERIFGAGACYVLQLRECGAAALWDNGEESD
ncbi:MAG: galactokinase [Oscillospiraceae bacterium]|nr:galactokinase [Oscillospiraceae bacterium]